MSSKAKYALDAMLRVDQGKGASRRLRRSQDQIPGIIYGSNEPAQSITLDHKKMMHALENPGFYSHLLTLNLEGGKQQVVLKALQRHPNKKGLLHADFLRVKSTDTIVMRVALHFIGGAECPGVKDQGGVVSHRISDLEIRCQAQHLPEFIEVDISQMTLDQTLHISDLKLPKGVESVVLSHGPEHDHPVVSVHVPHVVVEEEVVATPTEEEAAAAAAAVPADAQKTTTETTAAAAQGKTKEQDKAKDKGKGK